MKHAASRTRLAAVIIAALLLAGVSARSAAAAFSDVSEDKWYSPYVETLTQYGLVQGYEDGSFRPEKTLTRGEFLALVDRSLGMVTSGTGYEHWAMGYLFSLIDMGILMPWEMEASSEALNGQISRYEMAVILARAAELLSGSIGEYIFGECSLTDYASIPYEYQEYVLKAYFSGILTGYSDGSFSGERTLTRAEATTVICRLLFPYMRQIPSELPPQAEPDHISRQMTLLGAESTEPDNRQADGTAQPEGGSPSASGSSSFDRVESAVGFMSWRERNELLFGDSKKTHFDSPEEAEAHMEEITVRVWTRFGDEKVEDTVALTVNKGVAQDVRGIFELIFNGPEKYCIESISAYSWTDSVSSEHNKGTAIDINPFANPYVDRNGNILVGDYYDPEDEYSLTADSDVVKAFEAYGWGWGGEGRWSSGALDYMHMSLGGT